MTTSVRDFGAIGDGVADDTAAFQAAIQKANETGTALRVSDGVYRLTELDFNRSLQIRGSGPNSILRWAGDQSGSNWLKVSGQASTVEFFDLTLDGANSIGPDGMTEPRRASVFSDTLGASLHFQRVRFVNGRTFDIRVIGQIGANSRVHVDQCDFLDGVESNETIFSCYARTYGNVDVSVTDSRFVGPTDKAFGRAGIVCQKLNQQQPTQRGSLYVSGCSFKNIGYNDKDTYGAIDGYSGVDRVRVIGNDIQQPFGRGVCVKGDASDVLIAHNSIVGLRGDKATACIALFGSKENRVGRHRVIMGNSLRSNVDGARGILIDGSNKADKPSFQDTTVIGNIIVHQFQGIGIKYCDGIQIANNTIRGGGTAIQFFNQNIGHASLVGNMIYDYERHGVEVFGDQPDLILHMTGNLFRSQTNKKPLQMGKIKKLHGKNNSIEGPAADGQ